MMKKWKWESWCLEADALVDEDMSNNDSKLKLTFTTPQDPEAQTIIITGGNCEIPEFFQMVRHLEARVLGSRPNTAQEVEMDEVGFAPR